MGDIDKIGGAGGTEPVKGPKYQQNQETKNTNLFATKYLGGSYTVKIGGEEFQPISPSTERLSNQITKDAPQTGKEAYLHVDDRTPSMTTYKVTRSD